jgi:hypothetical protein
MTVNDLLLLIGLVLSLALLYRWQCKDDQFDLRWLLVDTTTEKVSLFKLGQLVALAVSTWAIVVETRAGHLTEWLFLAYIGVWSGANVGNKIIGKMKDKEQK